MKTIDSSCGAIALASLTLVLMMTVANPEVVNAQLAEGDRVHLVQANTNIVTNDSVEINPDEPPKRIDLPVDIKLVPLNSGTGMENNSTYNKPATLGLVTTMKPEITTTNTTTQKPRGGSPKMNRASLGLIVGLTSLAFLIASKRIKVY